MSEHKPGCPATGGYGHGIEPCICGASEPGSATPTPRTNRIREVLGLDKRIENGDASVGHVLALLNHADGLERDLASEREKRERCEQALRYVLEDDGLVPRASAACRKVVRAALSGEEP